MSMKSNIYITSIYKNIMAHKTPYLGQDKVFSVLTLEYASCYSISL